MEYDASYILGQSTMPSASGSQPAKSSYSVTKLVFVAFGLLVLYSVGLRLWRRVLLWRERSYKLATRRRHGIPDSDLRPFNVAYTEAVMKAREEENRNRMDVRPKPAFRPQPPTLDHREALPEHLLRQRSAVPQRPDAGMRSTAVPVPGAYSSGLFNSHSSPRSAHEMLAKGQQPRTSYVLPASNGVKPLSRHGGYLNIDDVTSDNEGRKRTLDETLEEEHEAKKSRVEGDELIDGDEDAEFEEAAPKRGSKRGIRDEEDSEEVTESKKARGKRARKVSQEKAPLRYQGDQSMDLDDEEADEVTELKSSFRGKKRDRAEAGSTFGGDDDDDSAAEREAEGNSKVRKSRKRRTVAKRKSEASYIRGKKRGRGPEDGGSDSEDSSPSKKSSRKRKGKRASHIDRRDSKSDISMDESTTSTKKGREIGEEWESNNVKYKIGPNGQKLRLTLVKKARQKFIMPQDSQHPDRDANLQVFIECWLADDEYQAAKAEGMLHWQDSPSKSKETEKLSLDISQFEHGVPFPQPVSGKNLLWSTSSTSAATPTISSASQSPILDSNSAEKYRSYRGGYRHSIATSVGLPISPFAASTSTVPTIKRIASTSRALGLNSSINGLGSPGLSDSTNGSPRTPQPHKVFSKWEKQELEAKAMMKMREANRKKEIEKEAKLKEERDRAERAAVEKARMERERQERERQEKERIEKEKAKAEADKKAKDNMSVPTITVTAPSSENVLGGAPASTPAPPPASSQPVPNFFNNLTNPLKPAGNTAASGTASPGQLSAVPNFFAKPASSTSSASAVTPTGGQQEQAKPTSPFTAPGSGSTFANGTTASSSAPKPFSFSNTVSSSAALEQKKGAPARSEAGTTDASFLSRLGSQAASGPPKTQAQPAFSFAKPESSTSTAAPTSAFPSTTAANSTGATTTPKFNFGVKPTGATATPAPSAFNAPSSSSLSGALGGEGKHSASTSGTGSTGFNFKVPSTPAPAPATNGVGAETTTTPAGMPKFNFGTPSSFGTSKGAATEPTKASPFANTGTTTTSSPFGSAAPSSAFGTSPAAGAGTNGAAAGPSPFGAASNTNAHVSAFGGATASKSPFSFGGNTGTTSAFGGSSSTPSAFGTNNSSNGAPTTPSPFGVAATAQPTNVFGGGSAAGTTKPAEASKPLFSFANPASSTIGAGAAQKPTFPFAPTPAATSNASNNATTIPGAGATASGASPFSFSFGGPASTTPQASPSPFGAAAPSGTSVFGGAGAGGSSTTASTAAPTSLFGGGMFGAPK